MLMLIRMLMTAGRFFLASFALESFVWGWPESANLCICSAIVRVIMPTTGCWKMHETSSVFSF